VHISELSKEQLLPDTFPSFVPKALSYSMVDGYERCGYWCYLAHVLGVEERPNFYSQFGSLIHSIIERDGRVQLEQKKRYTEKGLLKLYDRLIEETPIYWPDRRTEERYKTMGRDMIVHYAQGRLGGLVAVEYRFRVNVGLPVPVTGVIDSVRRESNGLHVTDYKTGNPYPANQLKNGPQLTLYAVATQLSFGEWPKGVEYYFLKTDQRFPLTRSRKQAKELIDHYRQVLERMKAGEFRHHCEDEWWCRHICGYGIEGGCPFVSGGRLQSEARAKYA